MLPHIFLAIPCHRQVEAQFMVSLLNVVRRLHAMKEPPFQLKIEIGLGDSVIGRARNRLAAKFLATDCTHLLFVDSDLIFTFEDIYLLLNSAFAEKVPCIACGMAAMKTREPRWCFRGSEHPARQSGLVSVEMAGTGFMLIERTVLTDCAELRVEIAYDAEPGDLAGWNFFDAGVNSKRRYVGEDEAFCELARSLGFPVFVHPAVKIHHIGSAVYPL